MTTPPFTPEHTGPNVLTVRMDVKKGDWEQWFLLSSDRHHDNPACDQDMEKRHLDLALERNAGIIDAGDLFCAMEGKWDKRSDKSHLRPEYQCGDYLDALVRHAADFYQPYAHGWLVMGVGNHECHDDQTEILTDGGWVSFSELQPEQRVATMNLTGGQLEWQKPTAIFSSPYCGPMLLGDGKTYNFCVTPSHDIVYRHRSGKSWRKASADKYADMAHRAVHLPVAACSGNSEHEISDDEIWLVGLIITDGSTAARGQVLLFQAEDKARHVRELLDRMAISYTESVNGPTLPSVTTRDGAERVIQGRQKMHKWYIKEPDRSRIRSLIPEKYQLPSWVHRLSDRQVGVLLEALVFGDGATPTGSQTCHQLFGVPDLLDQIQALLVAHGYRCSKREYRPNEWLLNICHKPFTVVQDPLSWIDYEGTVYCCTVPNGTLFTRRGGKVLVSGNSSIRKRHETDLTQRLVATLNDRAGSAIQGGAYTGWVRFLFTRWDTECTSRVLWYTHGYGGGGPVTQDMIQANRQQVYIENADIMMSGHVHRSWDAEFVRQKLNSAGKVERREGVYIKSPTYKDGYGDGRNGYEVEKGHGPRPMGAYWLRFFYDGRRGLQFEVTRAK